MHSTLQMIVIVYYQIAITIIVTKVTIVLHKLKK